MFSFGKSLPDKQGFPFSKQKPMKEQVKHIVSIDWLSIYCDCSALAPHPDYIFDKEPYGTSVFADMYTIYLYGEEIAILTCNPRSSALKKGTGVLKILNPILYQQYLYEQIWNLMHYNNIQFINISRLDLCADFNHFNDYPDMQDFFKDFLTLKLWKIGAAKYKVCANKATEFDCDYFKLIGLQSSRHTYQYLRFGSKVSKISAYLYNKTQEFRDVKRKNYIAEAWAANDIDEKQEVWRLEFSLKGDGIKFLNQETKLWQAKNIDMVCDPDQRINLYNALYLKYWDYRVNDGQKRKDRMKRANLLPIESSILKPVVITGSDVTDREQKRMITAIERTYDEVRYKRQTRNEQIEASIQALTEFCGLKKWHTEKFGKKYADMEFAEEYYETEQREQEKRVQPTLFDL